MALVAQFAKDLRMLFDRRTSWLHASVGKKRPGPPPAFSKKKVMPVLQHAGWVARRILVRKRAKEAFTDAFVCKHQWHVRRDGINTRRMRKKAFRVWFDEKIHGHNCVYIFWSKKTCEYVGRTIRGKGRPSSAFDKWWFGRVTRIDVYCVSSPSVVPKVECLAIDLFDPRQNVNSSSHPKYAKKCPVCRSEKEIRRELRRLFPLK